jgi:DNA-binding MarR family transcriptional regulator
MATEHAAPAALDRTLTWRLHLVSKLTDRSSSEAYAQAFDLPIGQARCLAAIGHFEPLSVVELAAKANLDKAQASRAAQALVARGLVAKRASNEDARGVVLRLTTRGRSLWARVMQLVAKRNADIFGCLTAADRKALGRMLDQLIEHARAASPQA